MRVNAVLCRLAVAAWLVGLSACKEREQPSAVTPPPPLVIETAEPAAPTPAGPPTGLWVWDGAAVTVEVARAELLAFCRSNQLSTLFINLKDFGEHQYNQAYLESLKSFVGEAHDLGLRVHAMNVPPNSPKLAYRPAHYVAVTYLRDFLNYNRQQSPRERFDGYQECVEPQMLPGWEENKDDLQGQFVDFVIELRKAVIEFDQEIKLGWLLPDNFDRYQWLSRAYNFLDYVTIMAFHDEADDILESVAGELKLGPETDTKIFVGVDTRDLREQGGEHLDTTFSDEGPEALRGALLAVHDALRSQAGYGGLVINDYDSYRKLVDWRYVPPAEPAPVPDTAPAEPAESAAR